MKIKFLDLLSNSFRVVPQINDTYPGIKGSTQGEIKLIKPAKKAIERETTIKIYSRPNNLSNFFSWSNL